ncbi:hypothetical protein B5E58_03550 [Tyzzerella sp. An114]|uniref:hypothetical protein n=1 Tax=Tyzzerella sp. An114 TaxID=1965545 RepID=UPI000B44313F|nr:hypothetical protein [Tyzzerella sp. An114]OUQ59520.1 hypothetical protein B5E58_03550 [Tyzzerella sp. An114]
MKFKKLLSLIIIGSTLLTPVSVFASVSNETTTMEKIQTISPRYVVSYEVTVHKYYAAFEDILKEIYHTETHPDYRDVTMRGTLYLDNPEPLADGRWDAIYKGVLTGYVNDF